MLILSPHRLTGSPMLRLLRGFLREIGNKAVYLINRNKKGIVMPVVNKNQYSGAIIDNNIKTHANDPLVLKKVEKAKQMVKKFGLPGDKKK